MTLRKTITLNVNLSVAPNSLIPIDNISFVPDEVIVRSVSTFNVDAKEFCTFQLWTDLIPGGAILFSQFVNVITTAGTIATNNQTLETHFSVNVPVQGGYNFRVLDVSGKVIPVGKMGAFTIFQLEFVKY